MTIWKPNLQTRQGPRYLAIVEQLAEDIQQGRLHPGDRLPTQRDLADLLGVTLGTVTRAYAEAQRRGILRGEVGRGTFVKSANDRWNPLLTPGREAGDLIDMGPTLPLYSEDPDLAEALRSLARDRELERLTRYQPLTGTYTDRRIGAQWLALYGLEVNPNQIAITAGAQHAITILLGTLCQPGDTVLCEAVTYPGVKNAAALLGLKLVGVPVDKNGLVPDELDRLCAEHRAPALYCMSTLHNPTTTTMSSDRRAEVARVARSRDLLVIEDDVHYLLADEQIPPLVTFAPERTFYIASTSKVLAGGLRVAYLVAPETHMERLAFAIAASLWVTSPLMVALASHWLSDGTAEATLERKRTEAANRQALAARLLPRDLVKTAPHSYFLWLELPDHWNPREFVAAARDRGVVITADSTFAVAKNTGPPAVRVSLSAPLQRRDVEVGLRHLAELLDDRPTTAPLMV